MNLYKILCDHYSPKDCCHAIMGYVLAENEEQIYEFIKTDGSKTFDEYLGWCGDEDELYWNEETEEDDLTHKEWVIKNKGELEESSFISDLYYGQTLFGWELVTNELNEVEIGTLLNLKIAVQI